MLFQMIQADGSRLIKKKSFWFAFVLYLAIGFQNLQIILSDELNLLSHFPSISGFEAFITTQDGFGYTFLVLPLLVALGVGDFISKERNSSMMIYMLKRTPSLVYIKNRILSLGFLSFTTVFIAQSLLLLLSFIIFPVFTLREDHIYFFRIFYATELLFTNAWLYILIVITNSSLMAVFFSTFSVIIGFLIKNLYIASALPYILLIVVSEIMLTAPIVLGLNFLLISDLAPLSMLGFYLVRELSWWTVPLYWIILIFVSIGATIYVFHRALKKEKFIS